MDDENQISVNDLIKELENSAEKTKLVAKNNTELSKENLEQFVLNSTGKLVTQGLEIVEGVKDYVMNNPESREVVALAEALKAVASALTVVKDIQITQMKKEGAETIKKMEIESRKQLKNEETKTRILLSRDEVFKKIMEDAKVIEAEAVAVTQQALSG